VDGTVVATITIPEDETYGQVDGKDLDAIQPTDPITIDITKVGTTFPGQDLTVSVRL
jgi:hypothetical protein